MRTALPTEIKTVKQAKQFLTDLFNNGESYHPEDRAEEIVWVTCQQPTEQECRDLNRLMEQVYQLNNFDPCQFLLTMINRNRN